MEIKKVCVLGTGEFGEGIARVIEGAGITATVEDLAKISAQNLQGVDLIIEAYPEDIAQKKKVFNSLDAISPSNAIFASTTSYLSVTEIASATKRQDKVIGLNFIHPATETKLVQIVKGISTSEDTYNACKNFVVKVGREGVTVNDSPGLILNRVLVSMINEAIFVLMYGIVSKEEIDKMLKLAANFPMGPLEYADHLGLDNILASLEVLTNVLGPQYRPCPLLRKMVSAGLLGKKTKKGFYEYK